MSTQKPSGVKASRPGKNTNDKNHENNKLPQLGQDDPIELILFMLSFLTTQLRGEDFLTKTQKQKIHEAAQHKDSENGNESPAPPESLKDKFTFSSQDKKGTVELEGRKLKFDAQSYVFDTPSENEDTAPVSPGQAFSVMSMARVTPDMANHGIEIFGPPEDMAMWLVAARHAQLNVTNMDALHKHISREHVKQAQSKFNQYLESSELAQSDGPRALFDTQSPGTLRQALSGRFGEILVTLQNTPSREGERFQDQLGSINHSLAYIHAHKDKDNDIGTLCKLTLEELDKAEDAQARKDVIVTFMKENIGNDGDIDFKKFNRFIDKIEHGDIEKHPDAPGIAQIAQDYGYCTQGLARAGLIAQIGVRMLENSLSLAKNQSPEIKEFAIPPGAKNANTGQEDKDDQQKDPVVQTQELMEDMKKRYEDGQGPSGQVNYPLQGLSALAGAIKQLKAEGYDQKAEELENLGRVYIKEFETLVQNAPEKYADNWQALSIEGARHLGNIAQDFGTDYAISPPGQEDDRSTASAPKAPEPAS